MQSDLLYYRQRHAAETAAAEAAKDSRVSAIHHELARRYDERIKSLDPARSTALHLISAA